MSNYLTELKQRSETEFLEFRQRIKETIRNKTQNGNDLAPTTSDSMPSKKTQQLHEFGCFFGPSQPSIASRVLQETKPLLKDELLAAKVLDSIQILKRKAKQLRDSRDYSFLFSDDAKLPVSIKEPPSSLVPNSRASSRGRSHSRPGSSTKGQAPQTKPQRPAPARKSVPIMDHRKKLTQKPHSSSKPLTSDPKEQRLEQRKVIKETKISSQMVRRQQALPPLKHNRMISKPPLKQAHQLKKRKNVSEEDKEALRMIREMCKTERRFPGSDLDDYDDDRCMEASLEDIIKEEKRSEKLAKKEDAEQLRLIQEEERRERVLRKEKRQKLSH
ncbi:hypothetical protein N665_0094s0101 [Sinapis alba]|nr:hypothetical protein N665_0094s0101 [Sinapis alba]